MKKIDFKNSVKNIQLSNEAKNRIKAACRVEEMQSPRTFDFRMCVRIAAVLVCVVVLSIGIHAAVELISFYMEREADTTKIHAGLNETADTSPAPNRAWNASEGEVMIKLVLYYMPEDIKPDLTANGKYRGEENNRAITFSGYDLRICDLDTVIGDTGKAEEFTAGGNRAFLVTSDSEIAVFNKNLYVLLEKEQMVIAASVGYGISEEEIKSIVAGLTIEETNDISLALPILNEVRSDNAPDIPFVIIDEAPKVYREDLLTLGESGHYEDMFSSNYFTVETVEIFDSLASLNTNYINSFSKKRLENMTDADGNFIPYKRTDVDSAAGKFGDTEEVTKRLVVFTVRTTEICTDAEPYPEAFLNTFHLTKLLTNEDGTIEGNYAPETAVINRVPGTDAGTTEIVYLEPLGDDTYRIAYIIDDDQLDGELLLESRYAEIYYAFTVEK